MTASLLNQATLDRLCELIGGPEALDSLAGTYRREGTELAHTVRDGVATGDLASVARAAHQLKSSAGLFGLDGLVDACIKLEAAARSGDATAARDLGPDVCARFDETLAELDRALAG